MRARTLSIVAAAFGALLLAGARTSAAQAAQPLSAAQPSSDSVAAARDLYASAAYEESLAVLNRLRALGQPPDQTATIEQYRAFCLLALGRSMEAQSAIEAIVLANPMYRPTDGDMSPRVRTMFADVRRRLLPGIAQARYATAKAAYDKKDWGTATKGFGDVLTILNDPDMAGLASQAPLSDIKTLAGGFNELSAKALVPPPLPPDPKPVQPVAPPVTPAPPRVYASSDANVMPPVAIRQELPPFSGPRVPSSPGLIEVVVDENGNVESATMRAPVNPAYDRVALAAASRWKYQPAMLDGKPVKFRKIIQISFKAGT
jgi:TonB family protein